MSQTCVIKSQLNKLAINPSIGPSAGNNKKSTEAD